MRFHGTDRDPRILAHDLDLRLPQSGVVLPARLDRGHARLRDLHRLTRAG